LAHRAALPVPLTLPSPRSALEARPHYRQVRDGCYRDPLPCSNERDLRGALQPSAPSIDPRPFAGRTACNLFATHAGETCGDRV